MSTDWGVVISGAAVVAAATGSYYTYKRGTKGDEALSLSQSADRRSKETETNLNIQQGIIDQLQEEVARYRADLKEKQEELDSKDEQLDEYRKLLREMRHELAECRAGLAAAEKIIQGLESQTESLRLTVRDLKAQIARHEDTMTGLLSREKDANDE